MDLILDVCILCITNDKLEIFSSLTVEFKIVCR